MYTRVDCSEHRTPNWLLKGELVYIRDPETLSSLVPIEQPLQLLDRET
jgi:hypothetical protein